MLIGDERHRPLELSFVSCRSVIAVVIRVVEFALSCGSFVVGKVHGNDKTFRRFFSCCNIPKRKYRKPPLGPSGGGGKGVVRIASAGARASVKGGGALASPPLDRIAPSPHRPRTSTTFSSLASRKKTQYA